MKKRIAFALLTLCMVLALVPTCASAVTVDNSFTDVNPNAGYYEAVLWARNTGVTYGKTDTLFAPDDTCTRGQVVTFLWRAMGTPEPKAEKTRFPMSSRRTTTTSPYCGRWKPELR